MKPSALLAPLTPLRRKKGGTKNGYGDRTSEVKCLKGLDFVGKEGEDGQ